jgi:hypothetical protein
MEMFHKHIWRDEFFLSSWTGEWVISSQCPVTITYEEFEDTKGYRRRIDNTMTKKKVQKDKQRSTKHTYRTKDRITRKPLKTGSRLRCSGRVSSFCSTSDTHDHRLHCITYSQNASVSIMLPYSSDIFNFAYTSTREELIAIFQLKKL